MSFKFSCNIISTQLPIYTYSMNFGNRFGILQSQLTNKLIERYFVIHMITKSTIQSFSYILVFMTNESQTGFRMHNLTQTINMREKLFQTKQWNPSTTNVLPGQTFRLESTELS